MRNVIRRLYAGVCRVWDVLDAIEPIICGALAGLVLVAAPLLVIYRFIIRDHHLAATLCAIVWLAFVTVCVRDFRRRQFSLASGFLCGVWLVLALGFAFAAS